MFLVLIYCPLFARTLTAIGLIVKDKYRPKKGYVPTDATQNRLYLILEHCREIFQEEKEQYTAINQTVRVYLAFQGFLLGIIVFNIFPAEKLYLYFQILKQSTQHQLSGFCFFVSMVSFIISIIANMYILRVKNYEKLSDIDEFSDEAVKLPNEIDILEIIISNYTIASERNTKLNNNKASCLKLSHNCIFISIFMSLIGVVDMIFIY